jgi:hypothetical protein
MARVNAYICRDYSSAKVHRTKAVPWTANMNSELSQLQQLVRMTPRTASGRVGAAWAVIKANLAAGKKLREVYEAAQGDGLEVPYAQFKTYVQRLRKRDLRHGLQAVPTHLRVQTPAPGAEPRRDAPARPSRPPLGAPSDPLRNVREQRAKRKSFDYDPFPTKGLTQ